MGSPSGSDSLKPNRSWKRRSGRGAHQFHLPSSAISEGTSSARMMVASISTARAVPTPSSLISVIWEVAKAPIATAKSRAAAVTIRPVRWRPTATASLRVQAVVVGLLDAGQEEHRVVGGEAERHGPQQDRLGQVQGADAVVVEQPLEAAVLEDPHQQPEGGAERQQVHDHGLHRQDHRAGHQEERDDR